MTTKNNYYLSLATLLIMAFSAIPLSAQVLEEIIVSAQKREQNPQDIGIAITAFSGDAIKELGFTNSIDIAAQTPGLNFGTPVGEGNNPSIVMRGVGLNDFNDNNEGPVAVYIDDVYKAALPGLTFQLFDLERIEVLKGPQGTLYGRNTTGGLMHFVTRKPTDEFTANADFTYGEYNQKKFEGFVNIPVSDQLFARASIATNDHDGYVDNRIGDDPNEADNIAGRLQLLMPVSDRFEALLSFHSSDSDANAAAYQHQATHPDPADATRNIALPANQVAIDTPECPATPAGTDCFGYRDTDGDNFKGDYDRVGKLDIESRGVSAKLGFDFNDITLTSVSAFDTVEKFHQEDTDVSPNPFVEPTFTSETDTFTQELRLNGETDRSRWIAGLYYMNNDVEVSNRLDTTAIGFVDFRVTADQQTDAYAVFSQLEYDLSDTWVAIGGLRVSDEEKDYSLLNRDVADVINTGCTPTAAVGCDNDYMFRGQQDNTDVSGRLELDYVPNNDWLYYASLSRGIKAAGFNLGFPDLSGGFGVNPLNTIPYDNEDLRAAELGFKSRLFDGNARLNASAYYYDYKDFQAFSFQGVTQTIFNTDATVYGLEFDLTLSPVDGLEFLLGGNFMDATAEDVTTNDGITTRDRDMVLAPATSFNGLARYTFPFLGNGHLAAQLDFNYQGDQFFDIQNHPISEQEAYTVGNARLSYTSANDKVKVAVFVNNFADKEYKVYTFDFTAAFRYNQQFYAPPRWVGANVSIDF